MGSLTARGRAAVVVAFVLSAALASGAAVLLVKASDTERTPGTTLPRLDPTLVGPSSAAPTISPTPGATGSPRASATPTPSASASASATTSPRPRTTTSPRPAPTRDSSPKYLEARATLDPISETAFRLVVRAVDGDDRVVLTSVTWGDGKTSSPSGGAACTAPAGGDCRVFTLTHDYAAPGTYPIEVHVTAGKESVRLSLQATVNEQPTPAPSAS